MKSFLKFIFDQLFVPSKRIFTLEQVRNFFGLINYLSDLTATNKDDLFVAAIEGVVKKGIDKLPKKQHKATVEKINKDNRFCPKISVRYSEKDGIEGKVLFNFDKTKK